MKFKCHLLLLFLFCLAASCKKTTNDNGNSGTKVTPTPTALAVTAAFITQTSFTAVWHKVIVADKYLLYVATDNQFTQPLVGYNPATLTDTSITINNLNAGINYFYKVQASANGSISSNSNTVSVTTSTKQWVVSTFAGRLSGTGGYADGQSTAAKFMYPSGITIDAADNLYVLDNNRIRKITPSGLVSTLTGSGIAGTVDGGAATARLNAYGITYDNASGNLFIGDQNCIRKVSATGIITTVAGNPGVAGVIDGQETGARLYAPVCLTADPAGNIYFYQLGNNTGINDALRKLSPAGSVTTLKHPMNINTTAHGIVFYNNNLYLGNPWAYNILKISLTGGTSILTGQPSVSGAYLDGDISVAKFGYIADIAVDGAGNFYIADEGNNLIRKVSSGNVVSTFAGAQTGSNIFEGPALQVQISGQNSIAIDSKGNLFVCDGSLNCIRKISYQ